MLDLIGGRESDEALAAQYGDQEAAAAGAAYLAGFAVEALALQRRVPVPATVEFLRQSLGEGDDGPVNVRPPVEHAHRIGADDV